jgi:hypothetical protein
MSDEEVPPGTGFLKNALGSGATITAWVFIVGWIYLREYYRYFRINVNALGFRTYHYLVFLFA